MIQINFKKNRAFKGVIERWSEVPNLTWLKVRLACWDKLSFPSLWLLRLGSDPWVADRIVIQITPSESHGLFLVYILDSSQVSYTKKHLVYMPKYSPEMSKSYIMHNSIVIISALRKVIAPPPPLQPPIAHSIKYTFSSASGPGFLSGW